MDFLTVYPRTVNWETILVKENVNLATIIYPAKNPLFRKLAENLADAFRKFSGASPVLLSDEEVMPDRISRMPDDYRSVPLILLGDINTNRTMVNLYVRYRCFADADYPGEDGYELRTVINPYTRSTNVIVVGGSTPKGVGRGVDRLIEELAKHSQPRQIILPFLLETDISRGLKKRLDEYPYTNLEAPKPTMASIQGYDVIRVVGHYALMYAVTGDRRYGAYAADCLRLFNSHHTDSYGDRHYYMERLLVGIYWLEAGGFFSDEEVVQVDRLLLGTLVKAQDNWWRRKDENIPLGHRHHSKGTYEFLQQARFVRENANISSETYAQCEKWIAECVAFLDALCNACIDDQDDETTLNNMSNLFVYSFAEERYGFFESGNARQSALRALALTDNMGAGAGQGGYGESHMSAMYTQIDATTAVAASAFYYRDPQLKWILEHMPFLREPLRGNIFIYCPIFLHNYATGQNLPEKEPGGLVGIQVLPVTQHQYALNTTPPENIVPLGHFVNAPETWQLAEGIGRNKMTRKEGFDKLALRQSFEPEGAYLLLQGYQGGYNWQGHHQAANCIVRFSQFGKIFLIQNARRHTTYDKNGVLVSKGWDSEGLSPYSRLDGVVENDHCGVAMTSLPECRGAYWRRQILWMKKGSGYFLVLDSIQPQAAGEFSMTCTWRTLAFAEKDGRVLTSGQGDAVFRIVCGEELQNHLGEEYMEGAASPYVWRQYQGGELGQGESVSFHNLFYARKETEDELIDVIKLDTDSGMVKKDGSVESLYRQNPSGNKFEWAGISADAALAWLSETCFVLSGAKTVRLGEILLIAASSFSLILESSGVITLTSDYPVQATINGSPAAFPSGIFLLPAGMAANIVKKIWDAAIHQMRSPTILQQSTRQPMEVKALQQVWRTANFGVAPQRIRDVRIKCDPSPANGFDEQLIDTVPLELREFWTQWYEAPEYRLQLRFPTKPLVDSLRLIADGYDEPMMRVFNPLPENIELTSSYQGIQQSHRVEMLAEVVTFKRYRGQLDRMAGHRALIGTPVDAIELVIQAPKNRLFVLQDIEIFGGDPIPVKVAHLVTHDLTGKGSGEIFIVTEENEIILLNRSGSILWRQKTHEIVSYVACLDLFGDGKKYICLGMVGGELRILTPEGNLFRAVQLNYLFKMRLSLFGWVETVLSLSIWRRDESGRAALAVGSYGTIVFLDPDLNILGHSFVDGSWVVNSHAVPAGYANAHDIWVRCGWNHGISVYQGLDSFAPSGKAADFGGVKQPLFRDIKQVIPFVNGHTVAFEWIDRPQGGCIVAAAENGVGVMDTISMQWLWMQRGYPYLTGCRLSRDGQRVILSGMDGFVTVVQFATGKLIQRRWLGKSVVGFGLYGDTLAAATLDGIYLLDGDLRTCGFTALPNPRKMICSGNQILVVDQDQKLVCFSPVQ